MPWTMSQGARVDPFYFICLLLRNIHLPDRHGRVLDLVLEAMLSQDL